MFSGKRKLKGKTNMDNTANLSEFKSEIEEPASLTWDSEQKDNACAKIKQKSSVRKQYKQLKSKIINKYLTQKGKKQNLTFQLPSSVENTHGKNVLLDGKEKTVAAAMFESDARKSCKEHVIDEDETDNESVQNIHSPRTRCSGENICGQTPYVCQLQKNDHNFLQGSSSLFSNDSFAPSLNNEISQDSEERYFYAKDQQDLRLLQILRYIKDTEGGIDLLYNFFKEYKELLDRNEDKIDTVVPQSSRERDVYCTYGESDGKFFKGNSDNFRLLCYSQKEDEYRYSKEPIDHDDYQMQLRYNIYDSKEDTDESSDELEEKINFHIDEHNTNKVESLNFVNDAPTEEESKSNSNSDDIQDEKKSNPYRKYKHNTIEREDNYSCDNEESSFSEMTSEESQNKDHIQQSAYSSDELSDVIQASALPYVGFSSNSSSSSFICKSKVANEVSIGIQVNLGDLNTQTSKKLFYIKTRSHKKRRTRVISYAQLTRRKNQKIRSCKTQNPGIHLKSTATNLDDGENYTYQHHSQNDNSLKEFHIKGKEENNYFNITGNTDESNDKINNTQTELFDNSGIHLSKESTNTVQETKSDMFASKTNSEVIPDSLSVLNDQLERKIDESKSIYEHSEHHLLKPVLNHSLIEASKECSVWNLLEKLESPFKWAPDIMILAGVDHELQENIIEHLTGKEKEFLNAETNLFREIVVRIVISYEKILDSRLTDALSDLQYCFELLEEPLISSESDEEIIEFNYSNAHEYYFSKIQQRRQNFYKYKKEFEELNLSNKRNENNLKYQTFMSRFSNTCITKASKQEFQSNSKEIIDNGCTLIPVLSDNSIEEKNEVQIFTNVIDDSHKTISRTCDDPKFANRLLGLKDITQFCCETGSAVEDNVVVKDKFKEITQTEYPLFTEAQNKMNLTENVSICNSENEHCSDENSNETHIFENNVTLEERKGTGIQNKIVPETYSKENKTSENETNIPTVETIDTNVIHKRNSNNLIDSYTNSTEILVNYNTILENIAISDAACDNAVVDDVNAEHSKSSKDCEDSMSQEEFYPLKTKIDTSFLKCVNNDDRNLVENLPESKDSILLRGKSAENLLKNSEQLDSTNTGNKDLEPEELRKLALECVIYSVLSHVAYFTGSYEEAYKIAKQLQSTYERLGNIGTATLFAVQGSMLLEYSFSGNKLGLEFLKKAQQLDPEYWEWNLLCGKVMGRIRRVEGANGRKPTQEEVCIKTY
ncbi:hypothetical protein C0J52_17368 [Blattella germanica]|nr:hypothetical protein C0J52_17368 [Blattella germanica]